MRITLVLLPGLDGTDIFFAPLLRHLPHWVDPVVISYPASGNNDYQSLLSVVMKSVAHLDSFVLLGWSFGGPLALMLAARYPSQVSGVILCGTFVTPPRPWLVPFRFVMSGPVIALIRTIRRTRLLIPGFASTELRQAKAATWKRVRARVLASRARAALCVDVRHPLQTCPAPLMYLVSSRDEVIPRRSLDEIQALAPHIRIAEVDGPHLALFTHPAQSADCIKDFMLAPTTR